MTALPFRLEKFIKRWQDKKSNGKIILSYDNGKINHVEIREIKKVDDFSRLIEGGES